MTTDVAIVICNPLTRYFRDLILIQHHRHQLIMAVPVQDAIWMPNLILHYDAVVLPYCRIYYFVGFT